MDRVKINAKSWHYRRVASTWDRYPKSLCTYFWKIVGTIAAWVTLSLCVAICVAGAVFVLSVPIWGWFWSVSEQGVFAACSAIAWTVIGASISYHYRRYLIERGKIVPEVRIRKEPGLVRQYLTAKHRKICPLVEYEYDRSNY